MKIEKTHALIVIVLVLAIINIVFVYGPNLGNLGEKENIIVEPTKVKAAEQKTIDTNADLRKLELEVGGMVCPLCTKTIKSALLENDGVLAASISLDEEKAYVYYDANKISSESIVNDPIFSGFYTAKYAGEIETDKETVLSFIEDISGINDPNYLAAVGKLSATNDLISFMGTADAGPLKSLVDEYVAAMDSLVPVTNGIENDEAQTRFKQDVVLATSSHLNTLSDALPGDTIYDAKRKAEEIRIELSYDPNNVRSKSMFLAAINRINEIDALYNNDGNIDDVVNDYQTALESTLKNMKDTIIKGEEKSKLLKFIIPVKNLVLITLPEHRELLENIYGTVPDEIDNVMKELEEISKEA